MAEEKIKVLIVDDATFIRNLIRKALQNSSCEVVGEATNGEEAIKLNKELKPDIITMDITMRGMDGITALKKILEDNPKANVIMLSSTAEEDLIREAIKLGAKDFITKPFKPERLLSTIESVTGRKP